MENRCGQFPVVIEIHGAFGKVLSREGTKYILSLPAKASRRR